MLSRRGNKQPVALSKTTHENNSDDALCAFCQSQLFTAELTKKLRAAQKLNEAQVSLRYNRKSTELYASVVADCSWCSILLNGILLAAHLDYWHDQWNGSHSDGSSMLSDLDEAEVSKLNDENADEDCEISDEEKSETSVGKQSEIELGLQDFEQNEADINVDISFVDKDRGSPLVVFRMIEIALSLKWTQVDTESIARLVDLEDEKAVQLSLEPFESRWSSSLFAPLPDASNVDPENWQQTARNWITSCKHHELCTTKHQQLGYTTRTRELRVPRFLIDITDKKFPKLVDHQVLLTEAEYVALSYVWGQNQTYTLTKSTVQEKMEGLHMSLVPKTILDAMTVCRNLGYCYLWVDVLCIIQDGDKDKTDEIAAMGEIYGKAQVTIIAASASSATEGFLQPVEVPGFFIKPFDIPLSNKNGDTTIIKAGYREYYKPLKDPVNTRAWTLQERLLSTKCLIYSYDGMKWCCNTCEENPSGPADSPIMYPRIFPAVLNNNDSDDEMVLVNGSRLAWNEILADYTSRNLTYGADKLNAISAVAFKISQSTGWTYIAGLWKEHLFLDLQWHRDPQSTQSRPGKDDIANPLRLRDKKYRAPSWSWASVDGAIIPVDDGEDPREAFGFEIISYDLEYTNSIAASTANFHFEAIKHGKLTVKGLQLSFHWRWADSEDFTDIFLLDLEAETNHICGEANFDAEEPDLASDMKVHCLAMSVLNYENRTRLPVEGLLLLPVNDEAGTFRRVGFFTIYSTFMFDGVEAQVVVII